MFKWIINKYYKNSPECICGYKMKPLNVAFDYYSWKCVWKKCDWETTQTFNGSYHWKKSAK